MNTQINETWALVLKDMKGKFSVGSFNTLFNQTALLSLEEDIATIATPSPMILDLLYKRCQNDIKTSLDQHTGRSNEILFIVKTISNSQIKKASKQKEPDDLFTPATPTPPTSQQSSQQPVMVGHLPRVRTDYNFSTFAVSGSNQLAFVSSQNVAKNPGKSYNPFFIYGPVGVGKTHLMHAIANALYQQNPDSRIIYITSEEFTNEVIEAIRNNETAKMKRRFRTVSLLLIDDIQFIEGKDKVQEELFHTFNILIDQGSQICLSSDRPPQEIKKLEKRLSSRFAGGLTVDIEAPDFELKTAILLKKAEKYKQELPIEVAKLIADNAEDTRSLEGLLLRIITMATTNGGEITLELAQKAIGTKEEEKRGSLHADDVVKEICKFYNIKSTQLKGPKRDAGLVKARQITMYMLYRDLKMTYVEIGNILGGRDHTTIMHGVGKIDGQLENNVNISEDISGIKRLLQV